MTENSCDNIKAELEFLNIFIERNSGFLSNESLRMLGMKKDILAEILENIEAEYKMVIADMNANMKEISSPKDESKSPKQPAKAKKPLVQDAQDNND